jgi:hypothetical protein
MWEGGPPAKGPTTRVMIDQAQLGLGVLQDVPSFADVVPNDVLGPIESGFGGNLDQYRNVINKHIDQLNGIVGLP